MLFNTSLDMLEAYKFNMSVFENGQPEVLIGFFNNFKKDIEGIVTITLTI